MKYCPIRTGNLAACLSSAVTGPVVLKSGGGSVKSTEVMLKSHILNMIVNGPIITTHQVRKELYFFRETYLHGLR